MDKQWPWVRNKSRIRTDPKTETHEIPSEVHLIWLLLYGKIRVPLVDEIRFNQVSCRAAAMSRESIGQLIGQSIDRLTDPSVDLF